MRESLSSLMRLSHYTLLNCSTILPGAGRRVSTGLRDGIGVGARGVCSPASLQPARQVAASQLRRCDDVVSISVVQAPPEFRRERRRGPVCLRQQCREDARAPPASRHEILRRDDRRPQHAVESHGARRCGAVVPRLRINLGVGVNAEEREECAERRARVGGKVFVEYYVNPLAREAFVVAL